MLLQILIHVNWEFQDVIRLVLTLLVVTTVNVNQDTP